MEKILDKINKKENLTFDESKIAFGAIMTGKADESKIFEFLTALSQKGETAEEISGGVYVLRNEAKHVNAPEGTIDTCGTGGDGKNTLNISTASA